MKEAVERYHYLTSLKADPMYAKYIGELLVRLKRNYTETLMGSNEAPEVYRAQGALNVLNQLDSLFSRAEEDFKKMNKETSWSNSRA